MQFIQDLIQYKLVVHSYSHYMKSKRTGYYKKYKKWYLGREIKLLMRHDIVTEGRSI